MQKVKFKIKTGKHYIGPKRYVVGDIIELYEHQAEGIMFKLERVNPIVPEPEQKPEVGLIIVETDDDMFDVINEVTSARLNAEPLTLDQAQSLAGESVEVRRIAVDPDVIKAIHRGGGRYLLVYDETEKPLTDKYFTRAEAAKLIKQIAAGILNVSELATADE